MCKLGKEWANQSVSTGTMLEEDLIPAIEEVLEEAGACYDRPDAVNKLLDGEDLTDDEQEEVAWYLNEELFDAMNAIAPEGCYFGSHPGDGADYGFWTSEEDDE
jgi:hypothetical protein